MVTTSLYVLRQTFKQLLAMVAIALLALLLERMLRLLDLAVNAESSLFVIFRLLINLLPHYLGVALPMAFFLGIWLAFNRLNRDKELAALTAAGIGLHRLVMPIMGFAVVLTVVTAIIFGYLQPYGRYAYRALIYAITHASLSAALEDGAFVQVDGLTFMAERVAGEGHQLARIFVHNEKENGRAVTTTAQVGVLLDASEDLRPVLYLNDGMLVTIEPDGTRAEMLGFDEYKWPISGLDYESFRDRGDNERELTLVELWEARDSPPEGTTVDQMIAEWHSRLVRIATILMLPLLAVPLALGTGRSERSYGIVIGLLTLIVYQKVLQFGGSMAGLGHLSPYLGLWLPFAVFAAASGTLFFRVDCTVGSDPLATVAGWFEDQGRRLKALVVREAAPG